MIRVLLLKPMFRGGPRSFMDRIRPALKRCDNIQITGDEKSSFDIELAVIRKTTSHNRPYVIRLDGCYYRKKDLFKNADIKHSAKKTTHIIYQSNFSKKMCHDVLNLSRIPSSVIHNGIDFSWIDNIPPSVDIYPGSFVSCSNWKRRDNKRPQSIIRGFLHADTGRHLYIIGDYHSEWAEMYKSKFVHFLGDKKPEEVISIMKSCDYQMHLCHIDSCPNAVVEGLACGLNVLCTNLGGTKEIVQNNGVVLDIDKWDYATTKMKKIAELDNVPSQIVAEGIENLMTIKTRSVCPYLDINFVATKYAETLHMVVKNESISNNNTL